VKVGDLGDGGGVAKRLEYDSPLPLWGGWRVSEVSGHSTPQQLGRESGSCAALRDRSPRRGAQAGLVD
jgi:hypothetical protein